MRRTFLLIGAIYFFINAANAQGDLEKILSLDSTITSDKVFATFKTTQIINSQSIETVKAQCLDFRIAHRFGSISTGIHQLYGFDNASDIRIGFDYGITDRLTVGFSRSRIEENLEGLIKYRLLQQTRNNKVPVSITIFANAAITPKQDNTITPEYAGDYAAFSHRISYCYQALIAHKFSSAFSLQIMPSLIHRNFIQDPNDKNDILSIGAGGRLKFSKRAAILMDYYFNARSAPYQSFNYDKNALFYNPLGIGFELETGGHVFTIMFSNSAGIIENEFIPYTTDSWFKKGFKFSFNISRSFFI